MTDVRIKKGFDRSVARIEEDDGTLPDNPAHRPPHAKTEATKAIVMLLAAFGIPQIQIANYIGIKSDDTLRKHYREELANAETQIDAQVISAWMKNVQEGKEMTVLRYMERKFLKPDQPFIPPPPPRDLVEVTPEQLRIEAQRINEEFGWQSGKTSDTPS